MTSTYSFGSSGVRTTEPLPVDARSERWRAAARLGLAFLPALVVAFAGFQRRWMSDDGHIYVRTVRQVLAGNGPVFNAGERAESSTGTLWQWLLVAAGAPGFDIPTAAMYGGLFLTATGFALAAAGRAAPARRGRPPAALRRPRAPRAPARLGFRDVRPGDGARDVLDRGRAWLLLVTRPRELSTSVVLGLGPLVRPDLALVSLVFLAAQWAVARPSWRGVLAGAGAAGGLPVAYEIFRMGYYGHLMPLPGVTKEASRSLWWRGADYLDDFAGTYLLWLPLLMIVAGLLASGRMRGRVVVTAPVVAGALCWLYVIKVGGDFMHGRMFLPGLLLMLLPVFLVPLTRAWTIVVAGVAVWAVTCAAVLRVPYEGRIGPGGIADERGVYVQQNDALHPVHHTFAGQPGNMAYAGLVRERARDGAPTLLLARSPVAAARPGITGVYNTLGFSGSVIPLSGAALDPIGLAYPLAAHSQPINGRVGHDKRLPDEWIVADRGSGARCPKGSTRSASRRPGAPCAASRSPSCGRPRGHR